ncbi:cache domain-containing protein [bacterium]
MQINLKTKLTASFIIVITICSVVSTWVGVYFIGNGIVKQVQNKVRTDLNSARVIYLENLTKIKDVMRLTANRFFIREGLLGRDIQTLSNELYQIREWESLDILTLTDNKGRVVFRSRNPEIHGDNLESDMLIKRVIEKRELVASTQILTWEDLNKEGEDLAELARIPLIPTEKAKFRLEEEETSGMVIKAAAPVINNNGNLLGVLYGGILLNRKFEIVDKIKETVYQGEIYKGKDIGTATIFQGDLRISTNVMREDGSRAIGTRVSEEVYDQVLIKGLPWIERAFVVNDWYISAYEPIRNMDEKIIGILYVGMLEEKFNDLRKNTILVFLSIALITIFSAIIVSYLLARGILKPVKGLVFASEQLAGGDLKYRVKPQTNDEIGELAKTFNFMAESLKERDEKLKEYTQKKIMESERLATIGQLAAGVAHEINNPLGGVLIYSHLILENLQEDDPQRENLEKIVTQATRCKKIVKGLLDFSRQTEPKMELSDINEILNNALSLVENQALFQNITIKKNFIQTPPRVMVDGSQIQQVFINIILNSAEAINGKGELNMRTGLSGIKDIIEVEFSDTGCGISKENIERLFEPFFTTKEVGHGTGLGLAISFGIIQTHKGTIEVKSQVGEGTTFIIRLPIAKENNT